jgi:hypothetical protein
VGTLLLTLGRGAVCCGCVAGCIAEDPELLVEPAFLVADMLAVWFPLPLRLPVLLVLLGSLMGGGGFDLLVDMGVLPVPEASEVVMLC